MNYITVLDNIISNTLGKLIEIFVVILKNKSINNSNIDQLLKPVLELRSQYKILLEFDPVCQEIDFSKCNSSSEKYKYRYSKSQSQNNFELRDTYNFPY